MKEAFFIFIIGDKELNEIKKSVIPTLSDTHILASIEKVTVTHKEDVDLTIAYAGNKISELKEKLEEENQIVVLIHLVSVTIDGVVIENIGEFPPYINKKIIMVSDGDEFYPLCQILEQLDIKVEYDENFNIK